MNGSAKVQCFTILWFGCCLYNIFENLIIKLRITSIYETLWTYTFDQICKSNVHENSLLQKNYIQTMSSNFSWSLNMWKSKKMSYLQPKHVFSVSVARCCPAKTENFSGRISDAKSSFCQYQLHRMTKKGPVWFTFYLRTILSAIFALLCRHKAWEETNQF